jgi:hypothetical protein
MKVRRTPKPPCGSAAELLAGQTGDLRLQTLTPERRDHRLAVLGRVQELQSLLDRRQVKPH